MRVGLSAAPHAPGARHPLARRYAQCIVCCGESYCLGLDMVWRLACTSQSCGVELMHASRSSGTCQSIQASEWNACKRQDLRLLAFANIPRPPPLPWQDVYALLQRGVSRFAASASAHAQPAVAAAASGLDLEWYTDVMARLHVNAFRRAPVPVAGSGRTVLNISCIKRTLTNNPKTRILQGRQVSPCDSRRLGRHSLCDQSYQTDAHHVTGHLFCCAAASKGVGTACSRSLGTCLLRCRRGRCEKCCGLLGVWNSADGYPDQGRILAASLAASADV